MRMNDYVFSRLTLSELYELAIESQWNKFSINKPVFSLVWRIRENWRFEVALRKLVMLIKNLTETVWKSMKIRKKISDIIIETILTFRVPK